MIFGKHINRYYLRYSWMLFFGIAALAAVDYFQLIIPELYRMTVNGMRDGVVESEGTSVVFNIDFLLDKICLPLFIVIAIMIVGRFLWRICLFGSAIRVETDLRNRMFDHAKDLSQSYYQINKVGNMMSLFTNDLETIQECFGDGVMMLFDALLLGTMALVKMWRMNGPLTLLILIPLSILLLIGTFVGKSMMRKWERRQQAFSDLSDFSQECFTGLAVVKAFVNETRELMAFKDLNVQNEDANVGYTKSSTMLTVLVTLLVESVICIILGYGGYLVYSGVFNAGQLMEFIGYFTSVVWPVMAISQLIEMRSRGKASLKRISELLDAKIDVCDREGAIELTNVKGEIEFKNLSFTFPGSDHNCIKNVSFKINAGERVGIVGKTGSGKTVIVDLILRTYNVPDGTVFIDGNDVNTLTVKSVRKACSYVPQDNFLFSDTVANNIAFAVDNASKEEIEHVGKLADVHDNIADFSEGYDTMMGERGVTVSGGQKQRISIARALLKNSPILILDDSVSAVDTKTEKTILENLARERKNMTTLLIAHRISSIEDMDKIIFVDNRTVAAVGTHEQLYAENRDYKVMVDLQKLEEQGG